MDEIHLAFETVRSKELQEQANIATLIESIIKQPGCGKHGSKRPNFNDPQDGTSCRVDTVNELFPTFTVSRMYRETKDL